MNASQNDIFRQLLKLLEENGRSGQAQDMAFLLSYMDNMSRQFDAVLQELQKVKAQLAQAQESPLKKTVKDMTDALADQAHAAQDTLKQFREKIKDCAVNAVEGFKTAGVSALDKAVSAMRVKPALESLQKKLSGLIEGTERNIGKVEEAGLRLRMARDYVKAAGRALSNREGYVLDGGQAGHIQGAILAPLRAARKILSGMNHATLSAIKGVEHLKLSADIRTGRKPSIRQALLENKVEIPGLPAPEQEHNEREPSPGEMETTENPLRAERQEEKRPSIRQALAEKNKEISAQAQAVPPQNKEHKAPEAAL